jgi:hypothetical protein
MMIRGVDPKAPASALHQPGVESCVEPTSPDGQETLGGCRTELFGGVTQASGKGLVFVAQ